MQQSDTHSELHIKFLHFDLSTKCKEYFQIITTTGPYRTICMEDGPPNGPNNLTFSIANNTVYFGFLSLVDFDSDGFLFHFTGNYTVMCFS